MDNQAKIKELEERNAKLEAELQATKEHLKKYTAPASRKEYYINNKEVINERNRKYDEMRLVHGLLHCKSGCGSWNRDRNGSSNIYKIAYQAIHNLERPSYLCREIKSNQGSLTSSYKQNIRKV